MTSERVSDHAVYAVSAWLVAASGANARLVRVHDGAN
jgi:hypothetical protein